MLTPVFAAADFSVAGQASNLPDVVDGILDVVARLLTTRLAVVSRIEGATYTVMAVVDQHQLLRSGQIFNLQDTFCVHMLERGEPLCISDVALAPPPLNAMPGPYELNIRSYAGVPLVMADGRVFGTLWIADSHPRSFSEHDVALLQLFAHLLTHELDQAAQHRHSERIEQISSIQANIDPLTGLLARESFEVTLNREIARHNRYGGVFAIATLQLGGSPTDQISNHHADILRQGFGELLMRTSRLVDCCARISNDTFAVLFADTTTSGAEAWSGRIVAAVEAWNRVHAIHDLPMHVQIGIADHADLASDMTAGSLLALAQQRTDETGVGAAIV